MKAILATLAAGVLFATGVMIVPPPSYSRDDQGAARQQMKAGTVRSLRQIESQILPRMRGMEYLGPEYDSRAMAYRLKFIRKGRVVFIDVDARTGRIIRRSR